MLLWESCFVSLPRLLIAEGGKETLSDATVELLLRLFFELLALFLLDLEELCLRDRG